MDLKSQITILSENDLREKIVIPLLNALGAFKVESFHGPNEQGKDVYFAYEDLFGLYKHCCIFLKKGNIRKSGRNDIRKMKVVIEEAISRDFVNPIDSLTRISVNEFYFICSGKINKEARDYLSDLCKKRQMPNIRIFDIDDLVKIIIDKVIKDSNYNFSVDSFRNFCERQKDEQNRISKIVISEPVEGSEIEN